MRLACIYALLDLSPCIRKEHLEAALALWEYCEASAQYIFGDALGDPVADVIYQALRIASAKGLTRTEISTLFHHNREKSQIDRALGVLVTRGRIKSEKKETGGRSAEVWLIANTK